MYTLRKIGVSGIEFNKFLGKDYSLTMFEKSPEHFWLIHDSFFQLTERVALKEGQTPDCYGFVHNEMNQEIMPLFKSERCYIVSESGKTFDNICY